MQVTASFSGRRWELATCDEDLARALALDHAIPAVVARFLASRGVGREQALDYLNPTLKRLLPEPFTLKNMETAVLRVVAAIKAGEKIAVFGDYDVDGSCSAAQLVGFLSAVADRPRVYTPDRMTEGYGPNATALLKLKDEGISLVVTVDCGAGAHAALGEAKAAGLDVIVLDHHATEHEPTAVAHVNPNAGGDNSGLGHLSAAGIVFLFLVALNRALRESGRYAERPEPNLLESIDLVGLATICDVVPLIGVNRAFVRAGLAKLSKLERPGIVALARIAGVIPPFTPYHLGFVFGPRINAGGRVGRCGLGVDVLTALEPTAADEFALALDTHNRERQAIEKMILDEATAIAAQAADDPFLLVSADGWHPGVVGIVAGRLKDRFNKPAFVAGFEGGLGRGSARSVNGINVGAVVRAAREAGVLEAGGGHAMAAGFSLRPDQVEPFRQFLTNVFNDNKSAVEVASMTIDAVISPSGATTALVRAFELAGPFGAGNPEPVVVIPEARVAFADVVGHGHVRMRLVGGDGARLDTIAFRVADTALGQALLKARGQRIHAAGKLRADEWNGQVRVQLHLDDAAPAEV